MNFETLHICLVGLHPLKSYDNITNLVNRILEFDNHEINFKINIIHDTTDKESYILKDKIDNSSLSSFINWIEYESKFLNSGNNFASRNYASLVVQNEAMEAYLQEQIPDTDFILRCRSDYYLTDKFLKMILEKKFYQRLDNSKEKFSILNSKLWMPYIGTKIIFDCCDYFYIANVKDQKNMLITDPQEAKELWNDSFLNFDRRNLPSGRQGFAERIFFIKPLLKFLQKNKINTTSQEYWDLMHSNFSFGGDPSEIKTCFYGWRKSAWCIGRVGYKTSPLDNKDIISEHAKLISQYSKIDGNLYQCHELSKEDYIY